MDDLVKIQQALTRVLGKYPVAFAYVFGSVVKGRTHKESDIDIALGYSEPVSEKTFDELYVAISQDLTLRLELDLKNFAELPLPQNTERLGRVPAQSR